jgi:tetratricopeptide (TPR) repeat protein
MFDPDDETVDADGCARWMDDEGRELSPLEAIDRLKRLQAKYPGEASLHAAEARLLESIGRDREAEKAYRRTLLISPSSWETALDLAELLIDHDRLAEAEALAGAVAGKRTSSARALGLLGDSWARRGRKREAERILRKALDIDPQAAWIARRLADLISERGAHGEVLQLIEATVEEGPGDALNHGYLGDALLQLGRTGEAEAAFRRALDLDPSYAWAGRELADLLASRGKMEESRRILEGLIDLDPLDPYNLGYLGDLLAREGKVDEAVDQFRTAIWLHPGYAWAARRLAEVLDERAAVPCLAEADAHVPAERRDAPDGAGP